MRTLSIYLIGFLLFGIGNTALGESLRCKNKLVHIGDSKAEVIDKCGSPLMIDSFCQPIATSNQSQGVQYGDNNVQNNIVIQACENIDIWTYEPRKGKFTTHLYFAQGQLRGIRYGDRVD
ncbi:DUF2845 domain-containing protein [Cellvibrio sp. pealriver]|uniref:DUF2845 domain-containing protein n=1 Tax=Cellvibrio sp. pealriver TaxID=1622269 RepID=UPI00069E2BB6|nr:DUF2845 domain-containing protein [Cellvibrio sp. pealriver]